MPVNTAGSPPKECQSNVESAAPLPPSLACVSVGPREEDVSLLTAPPAAKTRPSGVTPCHCWLAERAGQQPLLLVCNYGACLRGLRG